MRKFKAEALAQWDGLSTSNAERVTVLGATNRPWDLDEAVLRRFSRRLYVRALAIVSNWVLPYRILSDGSA